VANARVSEMVPFRRVRGARPRLLTLLFAGAASPFTRAHIVATVSPIALPAVRAATCEIAPTAAGRAFTRLPTWSSWCDSAPRSIVVIASGPMRRRTGRAAISRGLGPRSRMACASATAAWPSTAAWWSCVYSAKRFSPSGPGARPSKTWNFHSGRLRSSSTGCSAPTCASSSAMPLPLGKVMPTMCSSRSGSASTHAGAARFSGIHASLRRSAGASGRREATWARMSARKLPRYWRGSSNRCSAPTCIGISAVSR